MDKKYYCTRCSCWTNVIIPVAGYSVKVCPNCANELYKEIKNVSDENIPKVRTNTRLTNPAVKILIDEATRIANWELLPVKLPNGKVI